MKENSDFHGDRVTLCTDGKYRWVYEVNLFTNPTVFFEVVRAMLISVVLMIAIVLLIGLFSGGWSRADLHGMAQVFCIMSLIILGLSVLGYLLYAAIVGGKYTVLFILDEKEVVHKEYGKTLEKAALIGELAMLAGASGGRIGGIGTGLLAKSRTSMTTELKNVRRVIPRRWMNTIKVNQFLSKNRVYVKDEDFDFVLRFLNEHCVNARH